MAGLPEEAVWHPDVYLLEKTDPASGGAEINPVTKQGILNLPHKQLADRTQYLKAQAEQLATGAGYRGAETLAGSVTLTAADLGKCLIYAGATPITITLPLVAAVPAGSAVEIINTGTATVTVERGGSDTIDTGPTSATSMAVPPNMSVRLVCATGSAAWHPVGLTAQALGSTLQALLAANGWQRLPSGLILQWGQGTDAAAAVHGSGSLTFPLTFPNACLFADVIDLVNSGSTVAAMGVATTTTTLSYYWRRVDALAVGVGQFQWFALGY